MSTEAINKPVFRDLQADDADPEITEISSLCFNCGEDVNFCILDNVYSRKIYIFLLQGMTRLLLTKIPFYREIILMSFECEHCGFKNNEVQTAG